MTVHLKPELEQYIDEQVRAGHFASTQEALEAGIARLMLDPIPADLDPETLAAIERAEAQFDRGGRRVPSDPPLNHRARIRAVRNSIRVVA